MGSIALKHIQALRSLVPEVQVGALRSIKKTHIKGVDQQFTNWSEVRSFQPDFAVICSPTSLHFEHARNLTQLNIPFLIEKPVADKEEGLAEFCQELKKKNLITAVACQLRFDPLIEHMKRQLDLNKIAKPQRVRVFCHSYLPSWRPNQDYRKTYSAQRVLGGGVGLDLIHEFDYITWWFGLPEDVAGFRTRVSSLEIDTDDQCSAVLLYKNLLVEVSLSYGEQNQQRGFEFVYQDHILKGDLLTGELNVCQDSTVTLQKRFERDSLALMISQMKHFIECVQKKAVTRNSFQDGLNTLQIALNLRTSIL